MLKNLFNVMIIEGIDDDESARAATQNTLCFIQDDDWDHHIVHNGRGNVVKEASVGYAIHIKAAG
jgi:hypothetical protein